MSRLKDVALIKDLWAAAGQKAFDTEQSYAAARAHAVEALAAASTALERQQAGAAFQRAEVGIAKTRDLLNEVSRPHFTAI